MMVRKISTAEMLGVPITFKSIADLSIDIHRNIYRLPASVDLVVGIPRSGMLAASIIALAMNCRLCDLPSFLKNIPLKHGATRTPGNAHFTLPQDAKHVLLVDDSIATGTSMNEAAAYIRDCRYAGTVSTMAIYASGPGWDYIDIYFEEVKQPRVFQWNLFHRPLADTYCVDIDGVLCVDPTDQQNDNAKNYKKFLSEAIPLARPSYKIGHLVTSRLEEYRDDTENWLAQNKIAYGKLHMLAGVSAEERKRLGLHAKHKAQVYSAIAESTLFVESDAEQAIEICERSGKPVVVYPSFEFIFPKMSLLRVRAQAATVQSKIARRLRKLISA